MRRSMGAGIAVFTAIASAEVLIRVAVVNDPGGSSEHVLLLLALCGLVASCVLLSSLLVSKRLTGLPRR